MSGTDFIFNYAKGRETYYAGLPATNDALNALLLVSSGLVADDTLNNYLTLATLLAGASDECTASGYSRVTPGSVGITQDDTNNWNLLTCANFSFGSIASGATIAKLIICYNPDTVANGALGVGGEANLIPIAAYSFDVTTDGTLVTAVVGSGFAKAS